VWIHGISDEEFRRYALDAWKASQKDSRAPFFPEWALQELDQKWMMEYPSTTEASFYVANSAYVRWLMSTLGAGDGKALERLAHYLLSCVPGFRARMRVRSQSTDYDVYCAIEGPTYDFRSEIGRYFLCESKDWQRRVDVTTVLKFKGILDSAKCRFGIIFSRNGISGSAKSQHAEREILKTGQGGITILSISEDELNQVAAGNNFFSILRDLYERGHLDLPKTAQTNLTKKPRKARMKGRSAARRKL
jgi:restriction endonuclease